MRNLAGYCRIAAGAVVLLAVVSASNAAEDAAADVVARLHTTLIAVMKDADALGFEGRYRRLEPVVRETHDLAGIARRSVGRAWDELGGERESALVNAFSRLSISTYASRFDGYSGESFEVLTSEQARVGRSLVNALLISPDDEDVHFDYILEQAQGRWRIINIVVEGVSDLALKRSQYRSVIRRDGVDALIAQLRAKADDYPSVGD